MKSSPATLDPDVLGGDPPPGFDHPWTQRIAPSRGWPALRLKELWQYRDLVYFLVWRDIKARYAHSILGIGWAVVQPVFSMVVFTVIFGELAGISSDGAPYAVFSFAALVPWTYFSNSLIESTNSLIGASNLITKVYFPRLIVPLAPVLGKLVDFGIAMLILFGLMVWFQVFPTVWAVALPLLVLLMILTSVGIGLWLTALAIQYRDVQYGMSFAVQLFMYASPVVYPTSLIPSYLRIPYALNPMVGVIEGFRAALLGTQPMPWDLILTGTVAATLVMVSGLCYFRRMERVFADVA